MNSLPHVLVFDSGVGALGVAAAIRRHSPGYHLSLWMDNAYLPYGNRLDSELNTRIIDQVSQAYQYFQPDLIVIACNTASTLSLEHIRATLPVPIVGVVPAIKPAATLSQSQHIAVLATKATITRNYTRNLIKEFANDCDVELIASDALVHLAESKIRNRIVPLAHVEDALAPLREKAEHIDVVVLACTHFPLLREEIQRAMQTTRNNIALIDSNDAIARRVSFLLEKADTTSAQARVGAPSTVSSDPAAQIPTQRLLEAFDTLI